MKISERFPVEPIDCGADKGTNEEGELVDQTLKKIFKLAMNVDQKDSEEDIYLKQNLISRLPTSR
ncbi:MAG: hypothetical protein ABIE14_04185 [Patescibacteria group bacterium]